MESEFIKSDKYMETLERIEGIPMRLDHIEKTNKNMVESVRYGLFARNQYYIVENTNVFPAFEFKEKKVTEIYLGSIFRLNDSDKVKNKHILRFIREYYNFDDKNWYVKVKTNRKQYRTDHLYPFFDKILTMINKQISENHLSVSFRILTVKHTDYEIYDAMVDLSFKVKPINQIQVLGLVLDITKSDYYSNIFQLYPKHYLEDRFEYNFKFFDKFTNYALEELFFSIYRNSIVNPNVFEHDEVVNESFYGCELLRFSDIEPDDIIKSIKLHPIFSQLYKFPNENTFKITDYKSYCPDICFPLFDRLCSILNTMFFSKSPIEFHPFCIFNEEKTYIDDNFFLHSKKVDRTKTMSTYAKDMGIQIGFKVKDYNWVVTSNEYKKWFKTKNQYITLRFMRELHERISTIEKYFNPKDSEEEE